MQMQPFSIPRPFGSLVSLLPQFPPSIGFVTALNLALGRVIPRDALEPLLGRNVRIRVTDAGLVLNFTLTGQGFRPRFADAVPDLTISASAYDFLQLALRREDPDTLFFGRRLLMEGDTELGLLVKNTLDGLELPPLDARLLSPQRVLSFLRPRLPFSGRMS